MTDAVIKEDNKGNPILILKGVTLAWAALGSKREQLSGKYQVDACDLTPTQIKAIKSLKTGTNVRSEDQEKLAEREAEGKTTHNRGTFVTVKSGQQFYRVFNKDRKVFGPADDEPKDFAFLDSIGHGTKANLQLGVFENKYGKFLSLRAIVIVDLKEKPSSEGLGLDEDLMDGITQATEDPLDDALDDLFN